MRLRGCMAKKLSASAEQALSAIAHVAMAQDLEKKVGGMAGFGDFYLKQLKANDRAIYERFIELSQQALKDFSAMLGKDMKAGNE